jgi:uncharacterized protein GlcG (DUF336 family)
MAIALIDSTGHIVMLHKLDNTQYGSIAVAEDKAPRALLPAPKQAVRGPGSTGRPWAAHARAARSLAARMRHFPSSQMAKIIGAIDLSGATSVQDGQVAI